MAAATLRPYLTAEREGELPGHVAVPQPFYRHGHVLPGSSPASWGSSVRSAANVARYTRSALNGSPPKNNSNPSGSAAIHACETATRSARAPLCRMPTTLAPARGPCSTSVFVPDRRRLRERKPRRLPEERAAPCAGRSRPMPCCLLSALRGRSAFVPSSTRELVERQAFLHFLAVHNVGRQD